MHWRIEFFGGLRAWRDGKNISHFETRKAAALLAFLGFHPDQSHARELLTEHLWPGEDAKATRERLRQTLTVLRRTLEAEDASADSLLIADRTEVRLNRQNVTTDVAEFEAALQSAARAEGLVERIALLRQAVELYRGELLPGYYEAWIVPEQERLAEAYREALSRLAATLEQAGDLSEAIEYARRAAQADPLREDAHRELMRLYAIAGRPAEALRQYRDLERVLREELNTVPSDETRALLARLRAKIAIAPDLAASPPPGVDLPYALEPNGGAVPLESPFYIVRPTDEAFAAAVARRDSIVLVKGARQMGKTSLLMRGLQKAREAGMRIVLTDLQKFTAAQMESAETLFMMLAEDMIEQLELDLSIEAVWNERRGWNVNFERFLRREALARLEGSVVWGIDEVDRLFHHPFSAEVFGLFRSWHNRRALEPTGPWSRLTLALAYATEAHLFLADLNQSPFNVGTRLTLNDFTLTEASELNRRYNRPLPGAEEVARFFALVGGHPYLARRGLDVLATRNMDIAAFEAQAEQEDGLYGDHLRRILGSLRQDASLCEAMRALLRGEAAPMGDSFYRLRSAGVIVGASAQDARPRCRLYQNYFQQHLL